VNYLAHLYLSDPVDDVLLGNLMGDFVKGRLDDSRSAGITRGLRQHRAVDRLALDHPLVRASRNHFDPALRHGRSLVVDIVYDHLLARDWERLHAEPLSVFSDRIYRLLRRRHADLPPKLAAIAPRMIEHDWLCAYRRLETVERALYRLGQRLSRPLDLTPALDGLERHETALRQECHAFLQQARNLLAARQAFADMTQ